MNQCIKVQLTIIIFSVLILLTGCNAEGAFSGPRKLERINIFLSTTIVANELTLVKGKKLSFEALGYYSDGSSSALTDLSVNNWHTSNRAAGRFDESGILTGVAVGSTIVMVSKDGITSNMLNIDISEAIITTIQVTPSTVNVMRGQTEQLTVSATYSDGTLSSNASSVTWTPNDSSIVTVASTGLLTGVEMGSTTMTASKGDITSNTVNVDVCSLEGKCIDVFDTGGGKLFTSSPSVAYLDTLGASANNGIFSETGTYGPVGDFYTFSRDQANTLCATYNTNSIGERTNWRLATRGELKAELYDVFGNMFRTRGWPTVNFYWLMTAGNSSYDLILLYYGFDINIINPNYAGYVSCVSEP